MQFQLGATQIGCGNMAERTSARVLSLRRELELLTEFDALQSGDCRLIFVHARKTRERRRVEIIRELQLMQDLTIEAYREWSDSGTSFSGKAIPSRQILAGLGLMQLSAVPSTWRMEVFRV